MTDIENILEESVEIKQDLRDELEELREEKLALFDEIGSLKDNVEDLGENAKERVEQAKKHLERLKEKIRKNEKKYGEKIKKNLEKAKKKAVKRINISVDPEMSDEWRDWADNLETSVSELVRKSMKFVKNNIGDIGKLEEWGQKMDKIGENIEKAVKKSGLEDLGGKIERSIAGGITSQKQKASDSKEINKERIKKRIIGLIKLQKALPIEKLAQALNNSKEEAENLIYELVAEGVDGSMEEGVFKFSSNTEEVINKLNVLIDKI
jgi:predicted HicB family RNase H-like nuclease